MFISYAQIENKLQSAEMKREAKQRQMEERKKIREERARRARERAKKIKQDDDGMDFELEKDEAFNADDGELHLSYFIKKTPILIPRCFYAT